VDRLWREAGQARRPTPRWGVPELPPAEHILHRDSLAYLNRGYLFADLAEPAPPEGRGVRAELRRRVTRIAAAVVRFMLERHFVDEREFLIRLVQFENELARKCDVSATRSAPSRPAHARTRSPRGRSSAFSGSESRSSIV
jgi:hypothetical protein